jgi:hypothetical protein
VIPLASLLPRFPFLRPPAVDAPAAPASMPDARRFASGTRGLADVVAPGAPATTSASTASTPVPWS